MFTDDPTPAPIEVIRGLRETANDAWAELESQVAMNGAASDAAVNAFIRFHVTHKRVLATLVEGFIGTSTTPELES